MATVLWHPLPTERVRYVGEPVAMAWGEDRYAAEDLAEAVSVDYAPLPAGTPLHDAAPDGVLFSRSVDSGGLDEVMARAHLVLERTFKTARQSALPLEGRGVVAEHDEATGVTTVWTSTQLPHLVRRGVAHALGSDEDSVRVLVPRWAVGSGSRPACMRRRSPWRRWRGAWAGRCAGSKTEQRTSSPAPTATTPASGCGCGGRGRACACHRRRRRDRRWCLLGVAGHGGGRASNGGALAVRPLCPGGDPVPRSGGSQHRCPVGPCRGIGQNAAVFATEQMMDAIATELGVDPLELRRRNAVRDLPWTSPVGEELDSEITWPCWGGWRGVRLPGVAAAASHRPLGGPVGRHRDLALQRDQRQRLGGLPPSRGHLASRHRRGPGRGDGRGPGGDLHQRRRRRAGTRRHLPGPGGRGWGCGRRRWW